MNEYKDENAGDENAEDEKAEDKNTQDEKCQDQNSGMNRYVRMKMGGWKWGQN